MRRRCAGSSSASHPVGNRCPPGRRVPWYWSLALLSFAVLSASAFAAIPAHPDVSPIPLERIGAPVEATTLAIVRGGSARFYATPRGVFVRKDQGSGSPSDAALTGYVAGIGGSVVGLSSEGDKLLVVEPERLHLLNPGGFGTPVSDSAVLARRDYVLEAVQARYGGAFTAGFLRAGEAWVGGADGILRVKEGKVSTWRAPADAGEVADLAPLGSGRDDDLLVAFSDGVRLFSPRSISWRDVARGVGCRRVQVGPGGAWIGITTTGDLVRGRARSAEVDTGEMTHGLERLAIPGPSDVVTAIAPGRNPGEALVGTWRGRVLLFEYAAGRSTEVFTGDPAGIAPIVGLSLDGEGRIAAATSGRGPLDLAWTGNEARIVLHDLALARAPVAEVPMAVSTGTARGLRERIRGIRAELEGRLGRSGGWASLAGWGLGGLGLVLCGVMLVRVFLAGRRKTGGEERRADRKSAERVRPVPLVHELSADLAHAAERFRNLTIRIDQLSREAARGLRDAARVEARSALAELIEVEEDLKRRREAILEQLAADRTRLAEWTGRGPRTGEADTPAAEFSEVSDPAVEDPELPMTEEALRDRIRQAEVDLSYLTHVLEA